MLTLTLTPKPNPKPNPNPNPNPNPRWLGGPPLPEMGWEVGLDANRRRLLLRLCLRTTEALAASANALRDHGPFEIYRAPPGWAEP